MMMLHIKKMFLIIHLSFFKDLLYNLCGVLNEHGPLGLLCIWILGLEWWICLKRIGHCGIFGNGMILSVGFEFSNILTIPSVFSFSSLLIKMWVLGCSWHQAFTHPSCALSLWNHKCSLIKLPLSGGRDSDRELTVWCPVS